MYNYSEMLADIQAHLCYPQRLIVTILRAVRPTNRGSILGSCNPYFLYSIQAVSGTHAASSRQYVPVFLSPGWKWPIPEADQPSPRSEAVKKEGSQTYIPHTPSWRELGHLWSRLVKTTGLYNKIKSLFTAYFYPKDSNVTDMDLTVFHKTGLYPTHVHVGFVVDKVALR
jgi:hypothetical protein